MMAGVSVCLPTPTTPQSAWASRTPGRPTARRPDNFDQLRTGILISSQASPHELPFVTVQRACPGSFLDETRVGATGFTSRPETDLLYERLINRLTRRV